MNFDVRRHASTARVIGMATTLALSGLAVAQASYSAFSAHTSNAGNSWSTASAVFTNDKATGAFHLTNLDQGAEGEQVINFSYSGPTDKPKHFRLYFTNQSARSDFSDALQLYFYTKNGRFIWSGALSDLVELNTFEHGLRATGPAHPEAVDPVSFDGGGIRIKYKLSGNAPASAMGGSWSGDFVFEMRNADDSSA